MHDWDDAFANMAHIPGSDALPAQWAADAQTYRAAQRVETDIRYGPAERQCLDIVWPEGTPKGLVIFVHGGFWIRMSKAHWTHYAEGCRAAGWAVALPGYTLAPQARIAEITAEIARAVETAAQRVDGPIRLVGHSAGGQLAARMMCRDTALSAPVSQRLTHVVPISGVFDLRALMWTQMNTDQRIDEDEALRESPMLLRPLPSPRITAWVGGSERPEFLRQTRALGLMWQGLGARISVVEDAHHDHFSVLEGLRDAGSDLTRCVLSCFKSRGNG